MTPRSFFTILIKIIGIYFLLQVLAAIPQIIASTSFYLVENNRMRDVFDALIIIVSVGYYVLVTWFFLFKTPYIIDKLALDKHFTEDTFALNIHRSTILRIATIVLGAVLLIETLPLFCKQIFSYFEQKIRTDRIGDNPATGYLILYFAKLFLGYFMLTSSRPIVNFIERKRKK
jgi:hypothetical protein